MPRSGPFRSPSATAARCTPSSTDAGYDFQFVGTSGEPWNYPFGAGFGVPTTIQGPDLRAVGQDNHRGYGGATTSQILNGGVVGGSTNAFPGIAGMLNADNPDIVLLMIGTNGIADAMSNIDPLVNTIVTTKPNAQLIVAQIPPRATGGTGPTDPTVQYNSYIRNTVVPKYQALGKNVTTVDQFANLLTPGGAIDTSLICPDGAHLRPAANERLAQTWFDGHRGRHALRPSRRLRRVRHVHCREYRCDACRRTISLSKAAPRSAVPMPGAAFPRRGVRRCRAR